MLLVITYGTRPEFLKLKILIDYIRKRNPLLLKVIKIEQHTSNLGDTGYYDEVLKIDEIISDRIHNISCNIMSKLPYMIHNATHILAQGDTASVFFSLLCGFQLRKKVIHLEAGMRTYDLENPFPEEGYRQMISRITDIHLCPSETEYNNLVSEKVKGDIYIVGNTILDLVKSYEIPITYDNNVIVTLHRRENWDSYKESVKSIYELSSKLNTLNFYFLIHMNPSLQTIINDLSGACPKNMKIIEPLPHRDLISLLSSCSFVITDSGGIQEEANFLGKHIYVLRKITERNAISKDKITLIDYNNLININIKNTNYEQGFEYGNGSSCNNIYEILF
jgi:UDP-N-acetylglucosamine 2-epimerase (non-hydrolysing)